MKKLMVLTLVLASSLAHASLFDNEVTTVELAQAMAECPGPVSSLGSLGRYEYQYVSSVTGEHNKISDDVDQKTYTITSQVDGEFGGAPARTVAILTITATVKQSVQAAPASISWKCDIK